LFLRYGILLSLCCICVAQHLQARLYFIPGLGYKKEKPSPYVLGIESELEANNIAFLTVSGSQPASTGNNFRDRIPDMIFVKEYGQKPASEYDDNIRIIKVAGAIALDIVEHPLQPGEAVSIMGTSQGAVSVAQAVYFLLKYPVEFGLDSNFSVKHLVLAGSPVHKKSKLYRKLLRLQQGQRLDTLLHDGYQSRNKKGRINDQVTGLAGRSRIEAIFRGIGFLFDALLIRKSRHPHVLASENKPTMAGFATFGEQIVSQLIKDGVR
jgi:hypothetical protein